MKTKRLVLRPLRARDAATVRALCGNWKVACMLARVPHPYPEKLAERWIAAHDQCRSSGTAFPFGVEYHSALIGVMGLERQEPGIFELGYWIGERWWGRGLASEAAARVVRFAFERLEADELVAGHFHDNPASGRVLEKCGFRYAGEIMQWSEARRCQVQSRRFLLRRAWFEGQAAAP